MDKVNNISHYSHQALACIAHVGCWRKASIKWGSKGNDFASMLCVMKIKLLEGK